MKNALFAQMRVMWEKKTVKFIFWLFFLAVLCHYVFMAFEYRGTDITEMYEGMKLRMLTESSYVSFFTMRLRQFFPLLVVIPAGFSYADDAETNEMIYIRSRIGGRRFAVCKSISAFLVTFLAFFVPLIIEILLYAVAFPLNAVGDPTNLKEYDMALQENYGHYLFANVFRSSSILYAFLTAFAFSATAGVLGLFTMAVSTLGVPLKVLLFLPVYVILYGLSLLENFFTLDFTTNYIHYIGFYDPYVKSQSGYLAVLGILLIISVLLMMREGEREWLE